ncbi:unnamed protein product, partial [Effrenium voratum]
MSIRVHVALLSGREVCISLAPSSSVRQLRQARFGRPRDAGGSGWPEAEQTLRQPLGALIWQGRELLSEERLEDLGVADGAVTAIAGHGVLVGGRRCKAFALLARGSVVAWGWRSCGGDAKVRRGLCQVTGCELGFAALRGGQVVTWGERVLAGGVSAAPERLRDVVHLDLTEVVDVQGTAYAFAALRADGQVVTWGDANFGGDSSEVRRQLWGVQLLQATRGAFCALRSDGEVVAWGDAAYGGDVSGLQVPPASRVEASGAAFAALGSDGKVVAWGDAAAGGDAEAVEAQLYEVVEVRGSE